MTIAEPPKRISHHPILGQANLLVDERARSLAAIAGCVAGDTLIDTPTGSWPIEQLQGFRNVMALTDSGIKPVPAFIFRKGTAQLFRLKLGSGLTIEATADHYLLVESGRQCLWVSVGELLQSPEVWDSVHVVGLSPSESVLSLQESRQESSLSIQHVNGQHYSGTKQGCQGHYFGDSYPCDAPLPQERDGDRESSPSLVGALGYNHRRLDKDVLDTSRGCSQPYQSSDHPARSSLVPLVDHDSNGGYCTSPLLCELSQGHVRELSLSHKLTYGSPLPNPLDALFQPVSNSYGVPYHHLQSLLSHTRHGIASIESTTVASYYDMVVPRWHNYLAEGMIHHNTGGGKTRMGQWWLHMRMMANPGNSWLAAEPTFPMLNRILVNSTDPNRPDLIQWFDSLGWHPDYRKVEKIIRTDYGTVLLASTDNPDSMQGAAVKGVWLDEGGMMSLLAYQTALQRVSFLDGQVLITTTPYNRGWLKTELADKADGDYIHVEKWRSIDNPAFPKHVYEEMRSGPNAMQSHRFRMMYDAAFERPSGMIYNNFAAERCIIEPFKIPRDWPRYVGIDYGPVHTAVLWYAKCPVKFRGWPAGTYFAYREYLEGNKSIDHHVRDLDALSKGEEIVRKTGSGVAAERQWRREYSERGFYIQECPVHDVEIGIDRVYGLHQKDGIVYFNTMKHTLSQKEDYHRKLDQNQQPTDAIDNKAEYHFMDAERYLIAGGTSRRPIFEA